jgi:hypothetical protein
VSFFVTLDIAALVVVLPNVNPNFVSLARQAGGDSESLWEGRCDDEVGHLLV